MKKKLLMWAAKCKVSRIILNWIRIDKGDKKFFIQNKWALSGTQWMKEIWMTYIQGQK